MPQVDINYLAVLAAAIANMVIGFIWYGPVFGKQWVRLSGKTEADITQVNQARAYIGSFIAALVMAFVLAYIVDFANAATILRGLQTGFWSWLGFIATTTAANYLFEAKPLSLWLLTNGYHLLSLLVTGAILVVWV